MGRKIKVNWTQVFDLGKRTENNVIEFELARQRIIQNLDQLKEHWQGADAERFINNATNYMEKMKKDVDYFGEWAEYFKKSSGRYNDQVESGYRKVQALRDEFEQPHPNANSLLVEEDLYNV